MSLSFLPSPFCLCLTDDEAFAHNRAKQTRRDESSEGRKGEERGREGVERKETQELFQ